MTSTKDNALSRTDHALLIGIDDYRTRPLRGCINDVLAMRELLVRRLGFSEEGIRVLASPLDRCASLGARPARVGEIRSALEHLAGEAVRPGDRVVVYFSGHGVSREVTGGSLRYWVEGLLPVDYNALTLEPVLYDVEMNRRLVAIADRTENVTVILDCCHSSGTSRSAERWRGETARWVELPKIALVELGDDLLPERGLGRRTARGLVTVAACLTDEVAVEAEWDGVVQGRLTRGLVGVLDRHRTHHPTWRELWPELLGQTRPRQNPVILGDDQRYVFEGRAASHAGDLSVTLEGDEYRVEAGTLVDIDVGTEIAVYGTEPAALPPVGSAGERDLRLGTLWVSRADARRAWARAEQPFVWIEGARCRLARWAAPVLSLRCSGAIPEAIASELRSHPGVRWAETGPVDLELVQRGELWLPRDDAHGQGDPDGPNVAPLATGSIMAFVDSYIRYRLPLRLAARARDLPGALRLRLLAVRGLASNPQAPDFPEVGGGHGYRYALRVDDPFCIVIENTTREALRSVALLNCGASGAVQFVSAFGLPPGASHVLWSGDELGAPFSFGGPAGVERLVAIGSTAPDLDWKFLESPSFGAARRMVEPPMPAAAPLRYTATTLSVRVYR